MDLGKSKGRRGVDIISDPPIRVPVILALSVEWSLPTEIFFNKPVIGGRWRWVERLHLKGYHADSKLSKLE